MTIEQILTFNLALLIAIASPGPALLVAMRASLTGGRRAGMYTGLGLGLVAAFWTLTALLGLDVIFTLFPWAYAAAKQAGAAYLLYIAWQMWRQARVPLVTNGHVSRQAFIQGVLVNALNPKSVLFASSVLVIIFPADMTPVENTVVVLNHLLVEAIFYSVLASALSTERIASRYLSAKVWIDRFAAIVLAGLAGKLLVSSR